MYIKMESCRLKCYRKNQIKICADLYKAVVDAITFGETRASDVGVRIGSPRHEAEAYGCNGNCPYVREA